MNALVPLTLLAYLLMGSAPHISSPQKSPDAFAPDACTSASMTKPELEKMDKELLALDNESAMTFIGRVVEALQRSRGNLNFCSIEVRLRALGANTRLLALPLTDVAGPSNAISLVYPFPIFPTHSLVPRFAIWVERGGKDSAARRLINAHLTIGDNQRNLNLAGVAVSASIHAGYTIARDQDIRDPDSSVMKILEKYRGAGYLNDDYDPMLMYSVEPYVSSLSQKMRFSINDRYAPGVLQFFVISQDPDRLLSLSGNHCNCQYLPQTTTVICDRKLLYAIDNWLIYLRSEERSPALVDVLNQLSRDFLFHWLIGHEIGHYAHGDDYSTLFQIAEDKTANSSVPKRAPRSVRTFEASADQFAIENMPGRIANGGYLAYSYMFQQAFNEAAAQSHVTRGKGSIILSDPPYEHPDFLTRIISLKRAAGYKDFYLEKLEQQLHTSENSGVDISSVCELSGHEQAITKSR